LISISIIAVILLFFAGVIYPLSFVPLDPNLEISLSFSAFWDTLFSLKGLLLTLISLIFCGLMVVFIYINYKLKHKNEILDELQKYSYIGNYSIYFKNYDDQNK
jgi:flagellar biosynthesis protein FlhB